MAEVMRDPRDFLLVVDHAEIVRNLKPDTAALAKIDMGISGGAIVTASGDNDVDYVCRFFAPCDRINPVHTRPVLGRTHWQANISSAATQFSRRPNVVHASWRPRKGRW